jgi:hypothetical protein
VTPDAEGQKWFYDSILIDVAGNKESGTIMHCCWPCVCDTLKWLNVDTKTVTTSTGDHTFSFLVIGDPCEDPSRIPDEAPDVTQMEFLTKPRTVMAATL